MIFVASFTFSGNTPWQAPGPGYSGPGQGPNEGSNTEVLGPHENWGELVVEKEDMEKRTCVSMEKERYQRLGHEGDTGEHRGVMKSRARLF